MAFPEMSPPPGQRLVRHVGDTLRFTLRSQGVCDPSLGWQARLRTNLARGTILRQEIVQARTQSAPTFGTSWHDVPLAWDPRQECWTREFVLVEPGYHAAKAFLIDPQGYQHWPDGPDFGLSIHPSWCRSANTIYCAFTRLFGATRSASRRLPEPQEAIFKELERQGFAVLPPSGTFRDLTRQLPHIVGRLGCRILHLLPIHPTPTVQARFGRMGSPYAALDLTAVDPALVEFDQRTTGVEQFVELTRAAHGLGARVFLDIVINHTGWGSRLFEEHPEWFRREQDGRFACPGAWGVVWEDLVELEPNPVALWDAIADSLLLWCRRGVDGFRCDAGYKIPTHVWQYITARVTLEFPDTVFLLEGLGGSWEATETLLGAGGMQWAYSELFQNHSGEQVQSYLDYALSQSERVGTYVHYSETHDNNRLASLGRPWSLLRNRLAALTSVRGAFGFTCGVEWLATEKILVHQRTGLAWDAVDNLVPELARLNQLLSTHPAFFDGAGLRRISAAGSTAFALERISGDGVHRCLVLANTSLDSPAKADLPDDCLPGPLGAMIDLLGQTLPDLDRVEGRIRIHLPPAHVACLAPMGRDYEAGDTEPGPGEAYRRRHAALAFAVQSAATAVCPEHLTLAQPDRVAAAVDQSPQAWLAAVSYASRASRDDRPPLLDLDAVADLAGSPRPFPNVMEWRPSDGGRVTPVPPGWWLLVLDEAPFTADLRIEGSARCLHRASVQSRQGHAVWFPPSNPGQPLQADLRIERNTQPASSMQAEFLLLSDHPAPPPAQPSPGSLLLLTNDRGGMARLRLDLGSVESKYDCALGANLHPSVPVDRHVFVKRVRAWVNADGFLSPLDRHNLARFEATPHPLWCFRANAGDGHAANIRLTTRMVQGRNRVEFTFSRPPSDPPLAATLTLRVDLEDRGYHQETRRTAGAEHHFTRHTHLPSPDTDPGFDFTPEPDRSLRVRTNAGRFHPQPEWAEHIPHPVEASRGQVGDGDAFSPGWFEIPLAPGAEVVLWLDADPAAKTSPPLPPAARPTPRAPIDPFGARLESAARQFVVRRDDGRTVIAGYPWFLDWGRDTLIAARGLLAMGLTEEVVRILLIFGRFADRGTLPNSIHGDDAGNRDTSDAPLWFGIVLGEATERLGTALLEQRVSPSGPTLLQVMRRLAEGYLSGTPNGIRVDAATGLVWSPSHFTWMDTNHPAGTPREGYPIEIQALWIRCLDFLLHHDGPHSSAWKAHRDRALASFRERFWMQDRGWFSDVLLAPAGRPAAEGVVDTSLRPNQLFAIAFGLAPADAAQSAVRAALRHLLVPGGVRSLAPLPVSPPLVIRSAAGWPLNDPHHPYWGRYQGDEDTRRKPAYHNGTAWCWLLPVLAEALAAAWDRHPAALRAARSLLLSSSRLLDTDCIGHLPEILDGDAPHTPRGCDAQAWSVTEAFRVWRQLADRTDDEPGGRNP